VVIAVLQKTILTSQGSHASMKTSLEKEVVQQKWKLTYDRERWPTVEVEPLM
jgi:hypothetical protein